MSALRPISLCLSDGAVCVCVYASVYLSVCSGSVHSCQSIRPMHQFSILPWALIALCGAPVATPFGFSLSSSTLFAHGLLTHSCSLQRASLSTTQTHQQPFAMLKLKCDMSHLKQAAEAVEAGDGSRMNMSSHRTHSRVRVSRRSGIFGVIGVLLPIINLR